jgi:hypothetical protein
MIAILDHNPLVEFPDGRQVPFERRWLEFCLRETARKAGLTDWCLEVHLAESVSLFLRFDYQEPLIPSEKLRELTARALSVAGFQEIGEAFSLLPPPARLSLLEVAEAAGMGYELGFFALLSSRLRGLLAGGARQIACEDLRPCVKRLRQAQRWRGDCRGLGEEIVAFIRAECSRSPLAGPASSPPALQLALS